MKLPTGMLDVAPGFQFYFPNHCFSLSISISLAFIPLPVYIKHAISNSASFQCLLLPSLFPFTSHQCSFSLPHTPPFTVLPALNPLRISPHFSLHLITHLPLFSSVLLLLEYPLPTFFSPHFSSVPISHNCILSSNISIVPRSDSFVHESSLFWGVCDLHYSRVNINGDWEEPV